MSRGYIGSVLGRRQGYIGFIEDRARTDMVCVILCIYIYMYTYTYIHNIHT